MWHTVLQPASFKGTAFDVENVEERNGRVLAEHARPFADGTDLEDMGTSGREVRISAVFWGKGYAVRLKNLLDKLEERGAGVLVHPVWGRMTDMAAAEWSYQHEADYADFARIDMTFREAAEPQEIFVFENHFLMEIERLIVQTDALRAAAEGFIDALAAGPARGGGRGCGFAFAPRGFVGQGGCLAARGFAGQGGCPAACGCGGIGRQCRGGAPARSDGIGGSVDACGCGGFCGGCGGSAGRIRGVGRRAGSDAAQP